MPTETTASPKKRYVGWKTLDATPNRGVLNLSPKSFMEILDGNPELSRSRFGKGKLEPFRYPE